MISKICWVLSVKITISLGKNPRRGGRPPSDSKSVGIDIVIKDDFLLLFICLTDVELILFISKKIGALTTIYTLK